MFARGKARKGRAVGHVQIHVAIAVVIKKSGTTHHPLDYVALVRARDIALRQASVRRPIDKLRGERLAPPTGGSDEAPDRAPYQRAHYSCSTTKNRSTGSLSRSCTLPSGQVISIRSTSAQSPKPKCNRLSLADR